jgi:hypothetical protein
VGTALRAFAHPTLAGFAAPRNDELIIQILFYS